MKGHFKPHTEETKRRISIARRGIPAWNKGKKSLYPAWNKGKTGFKKKNLKGLLIPCQECFKQIYRIPSIISKNNFCNRMCYSKWIKTNPLWGSWNKGLKHTQEHIEKCRKTNKMLYATGKRIHHFLGKKRPEMTGANNWRWIMDRSTLSKSDEFRNSAAHREWSKQVKNRDYWKCQISNDNCSGRVEAHHILGWKDHPELRYEIKNGITLCHFHHPKKREDEKRMIQEFQKIVSNTM